MAANPTTADQMFDRLLADRAFRIRTIVADNFAAVRANYLATIQSGYPEKVDTPTKLTTELLWWDKYQSKADVDQVINVQYKGTDPLVTQAMTKAYDIAVESGVGPKAMAPEVGGGLLAGIGGLFGAIASVANGGITARSNERMNAEALEAQFALDQQKGERNAKLIKLGIIAGAIVLTIVAFALLKSRTA
jgi:hypothetical protein